MVYIEITGMQNTCNVMINIRRHKHVQSCITLQQMKIIIFLLMLKLLAMSPPEAGNISDTQPWDSIRNIIT